MLLSVVSLAWSAAARAGEVVVVLSSEARPYQVAAEVLTKQLSQKGRHCRTVLLSEAEKKPAMVNSDAEVVVALGTPAALALREKLPDKVPLVYALVAGPRAAGLTSGRPMIGVSTDVPLSAQFKLIERALPEARVVGMLYDSKVEASRELSSAAMDALPQGWRMEAVAVDQHESVASAINELLSRRVDVVWTAPDPAVFNTNTVRALLLGALRRGRPVFGFSPAFVQAGALFGVGIDPADQGRQAARLVEHVLKDPAGGPNGGQKQAIGMDGGVMPPDHQIAVNLIVARELRIELPRDLIERAAYVFRPKEGEGR